MKTINILVRITNAFTNACEKYEKTVLSTLTFEEIDSEVFEPLKQANPDCFVNLDWKPVGAESNSFICGQPLNLQKDEAKVDADEMTFEEYIKKWFTRCDDTQSWGISIPQPENSQTGTPKGWDFIEA